MISVIIPCYNAEQTVAATISSALEQDVEKEIIVINDGSTDGSAKVISQFGHNVHTVTTPNRGASSARETGTSMARGAYIQYLDSDDLLTRGTLAARLRALDLHRADVAHTDWQKLEHRGNGSSVLGDIMRPDLSAIERDAEAAAATSDFWAPPAALLYRRTIVDRIGGWHTGLPVIQDARYLFEAARHQARFVHVPEIGAYYKVHHGSLSRRNLKEFIADCARNTTEIEALWRGQGALSPSRVDALTRMWGHVVKAALLGGLDEFEKARAGYNRVAAHRSLFEAGYILRRAIGAKATSSVLQTALRSKQAFLKPMDMGVGRLPRRSDASVN
jgi:glycosyltransferase involved in cell wall biosynthesis